MKIEVVEVYGSSLCDSDTLERQNFFSVFQGYFKNSENKKVIYIEAPTIDVLLSFERMLYLNRLESLSLHNSPMTFVLDISSIQKNISPRSLSSFALIHYEPFKEYITSVSEDWPLANLPEDKHRLFNRIFSDIVFPTIENLTQHKDQLKIE